MTRHLEEYVGALEELLGAKKVYLIKEGGRRVLGVALVEGEVSHEARKAVSEIEGAILRDAGLRLSTIVANGNFPAAIHAKRRRESPRPYLEKARRSVAGAKAALNLGKPRLTAMLAAYGGLLAAKAIGLAQGKGVEELVEEGELPHEVLSAVLLMEDTAKEVRLREPSSREASGILEEAEKLYACARLVVEGL